MLVTDLSALETWLYFWLFSNISNCPGRVKLEFEKNETNLSFSLFSFTFSVELTLPARDTGFWITVTI